MHELKTIEKDLILKKHSSIIQINSSLTLQQRKLFNLILLNSTKNKWDKNNLSYIEIKELKKILNISHKNNKYIKDNIIKLQEIIIEFNILDKDNQQWGRFSLIQEPEIINGVLSYSLPNRIKKTIEEGLPPFAILDLKVINNLTTKYSIVLYELLTDYYSDKYKKLLLPKLEVEQFKILLGIPDQSYKEIKDLKRYVIKEAITELNSKTNYEINYEVRKVNNANYVFFTMKVKSNKKEIIISKLNKAINKDDKIQNHYNEMINEEGYSFQELKLIENQYILVYENNLEEIEIELEAKEITKLETYFSKKVIT